MNNNILCIIPELYLLKVIGCRKIDVKMRFIILIKIKNMYRISSTCI